jgi:beta-lactamase superfamily II metal-dependent hydrolase
MRSRQAEGLVALLVLFACAYGAAPPQPLTPEVPAVRELIVRVLDVGQGDANYIENGTSRIIIDGGPSPARFGRLLESLGLNNTTINVVILSHEHLDHYSGLRELFRTSRNITINYFFENKNLSTAVTLAELRDSINADLETMSVGANNAFGHVHEQTKSLWRARTKPWYRTDQNGTITFRTPGTVGGGYAVAVGKGVASMSGAPDATSAQVQCSPIP